MNVLITSASRKVSLVRAFQSALDGCGKVIAVDITPYAPALHLADKWFLVPRSAEPRFEAELFSLCKREEIKLVVPTRDEELPLFAALREMFEKAGIRVLAPSPETVRRCQDKQIFLDFCRENGFATPRTYADCDRPQLPVFVKPRFGKGGKGARRISSPEELEILGKESDGWIIQECVEDPEYSIDLLCDFDGNVISVVPRSRQFVVAGESYISRTVNEPELIKEAARLATTLGLVAHNTIQCFWNGKDVKFIEVNPRFGGAVALSIAAGADTPRMLIELVNNQPVNSNRSQFEPGLVMLRYTNDIFLRAAEIESPQTSRLELNQKTAAAPKGIVSFEAVLFDLDNTLYPEEEFVRSGFRAVAEFLAPHLRAESEVLLNRMLEILSQSGRGKVFDILLKELSLESKLWLKTLLWIYRSHRPHITLFPEFRGILDGLKEKGVRLGLVTDGMASVQRNKIAALGLETKMDVIICTDELGPGCGKPSTIPFEIALAVLRVESRCAAYVADDISKDFAGPNRLGMRSIRVRSDGLIGVAAKPISSKEFEPQFETRSSAELLRVLQS